MRKLCNREIISKNLKVNYKVLWDPYNKTVWIVTNRGELEVGTNCQTEESAIRTAQRLVDSQPYY